MDNLKNIDMIVRSLKEHGLSRIVISPGGTNQAFAKAVQDDSFFQCYSVVDERSAIYFAIGLYLQTGDTIVTSCTSAQATRNYIPGLTEAFYKRVPILAITMSKHPRFTYQEYMQAPDQTSLPKDCVKHSFSLPCINDNNDVLFSKRQIEAAILEVSHHSLGPVQLCVPWLDFPLEGEVRDNKTIIRTDKEDNLKDRLSGKKIMICIGEHMPFTSGLHSEIERFSECYNVVIYSNHISNYHGKYVIQGTLPLLTININLFREKLKPDVLLTIGGQTGDYPFYNLFARNDLGDIEHWRVAPDGNVVDTYDKLTTVIQMDEESFFSRINNGTEEKEVMHDLYLAWENYYATVNTQIDVPFSAVSVAREFSKRIPGESVLQFSILNTLRVWNMFHIDSSIRCFANVGAFGIDGGMSTLIGQSVISDRLCFMIIGDLAFLYDMNAISIRHIKSNLRILIINNAGGVEFKLWGGDNSSIDRYIAGAGHFSNASGWAQTCGFKYISVSSQEQFSCVIDEFIGESDRPIVLEAFISDKAEQEAYSSIVQANINRSLKDKAKAALLRIMR